MLASVDGAIGPAEEARIPVTDEGLTRGDGAFEVMRLYGGRPFALEDHLTRLDATCAGLRLEYDRDAVRAESLALLERGDRDLRAESGAGRAQDAVVRGQHAGRAAGT
jgi:branched-chain amino acid aminotransferase